MTLFIAFKRQNKINAMIRKFTTEDPNADAYPEISSNVYFSCHNQFYDWLKKLSVSDVTIPEKAPPINTPTAISITLPRSANDLNSSKNFSYVSLLYIIFYNVFYFNTSFDKTIYSLIICSLKYDKKIQNALKKRPY